MIKLTATDLPRFMVCNGSILMPENPRFNIDDTIRNEGIAAHWLIEQVHKRIHGTDELVDRKALNGVFITGEMVEHVMPFLEAIRGKGMVECDTSYSDGQHYQINGRADHIYYEPALYRLHVSDFKYGWSIIEPEKNWTLISHAIGWMLANPTVRVDMVALRIYQPRPHHSLGKIREHIYHAESIKLFHSELHQALLNPTNQLQTSDECRNCPALATCPAAQKAGMNAIEVSETAFVSDVDNNNLAFLLDQIKRSLKVLEQNEKAYSELALHRLKAGQIIPNYGTERELTNEQWKTGINIETAKLLTGKDLGKKQLITPAQAVKAGVSPETVKTMCERREKGVKLVRMDLAVAAKKMFGDLK